MTEILYLYSFNHGKLEFHTADHEQIYLLELNSDNNLIYADGEAYELEELEELGTVTIL